MKELCIPIMQFGEDQSAEISLKVGEKRMQFEFRVASFPWEIEDDLSNGDDQISKSLARISRLKNAIGNYDTEWELMQIYTPIEDARFIQVLYRKKNK
ncbi:MAG: hypothetical protein U9N53_14165 [Bacteroidota bacterium]|nr:hypothetical protein [Bacteroidota bacterium]